ncbi:methylisocitrate lyase [Enterocloster asparagiformis]|uniref:isocitrate lyase/PEP mutase family protein n=1 Tax=Enterocloster asparagiformis TaxID=333367 RepID=UPI002355B852
MTDTSLKELLEKGPVFAPCVYDCLSAKIVENIGFKAMCLSGGNLAMSLIGVPDIGLVSFGELLDAVRRITCYSKIPMIVDIDTGFGNELNVIRTCERVAQAGAMAVHLEDQTFPKRCGHMSGKEVISRKDYIAKVKAAKYALEGTDCLLIARTDSYFTDGLDEAIYRNLASLEAGADITLTEGTRSVDDIEKIARMVPGWKMFGMNSMGASPKVTFDELVEMGYQLVTCHFAKVGAIKGITKLGEYAFKEGHDFHNLEEGYDNFKSHEMFGIHEWYALAKRFNPDIKDAEPVKAEV